jgi:multiple sugar transport system permease protein
VTRSIPNARQVKEKPLAGASIQTGRPATGGVWARARKQSTPYLLILPAVLALVLFSVYPFVSGILYAFTDIKFVGGSAHWIAFDNFEYLLKGSAGTAAYFNKAFRQTILWTVCVVGGQLVLGYITALLLNEKLPGRSLFRTLIILPWAVPSVVVGLTWQWMYDPFFGVINYYLKAVGLIADYHIWVGQPNSTIWPIIVVGIWRGLPFMALMLLSGLQSIPAELYEAAKVDGANALQRFRHITLPQMRTITVVVVMLTTMWWWNSFDLQRIMSPVASLGYNSMTLPILAWFEAFQWKHLGRGAAISVLSLLVMLLVIIGNVRREMKAVTE